MIAPHYGSWGEPCYSPAQNVVEGEQSMNEVNKKVVRDVYSAFQRGNIPDLLDCLTDDVH